MRPIAPTLPRHPPTSLRRTRSPRRRVIAAGLFLSGGLIAAGMFTALSLARKPPGWWGPSDAADPESLQTARTLENGIATLLTKVRSTPSPKTRETPSSDPEFWTVALKATDANAWLATRLRVWLENDSDHPFHWPEAVTGVQVRFENGVISIGASIAGPAGVQQASDSDGQSDAAVPPPSPQVLTASLVPQFRTDGSFWLPARWLSVGRLSLPAAWMLSAAAPQRMAGRGSDLPPDLAALPQTRDLLAAFAGKVPVMRSPIIKIGDGRRVRLVSLDARDGRLLITCQTLPRDAARASK